MADGDDNFLPSLKELRKLNANANCPEVAWIWGPEDELGRLNLLTESLISKVAKEEVQSGCVISLNWNIELPAQPNFDRSPCKVKILPNTSSDCIFDDSLEMNTQSGSQWDGFRHFGHQTHGFLYNNLSPEDVTLTDRCGMHVVSRHGIVGRGVFIDYYRYAQKFNKPYDPLTSHAINLNELLACANYQGTQFQKGDILIIRSGYVSRYNELQESNPAKLERSAASNPTLAGVEQSEEMKTWLHDSCVPPFPNIRFFITVPFFRRDANIQVISYFAAVAGDAPSFEVWPSSQSWYLHEYLLACWGVMIGEMFDLEIIGSVN
ncbi:putative cyclase [Penicillium argentinense]|uniref:Cyclase n=1 Tax=Penicillium argentinense TaxID=1131581 RepID=A0A9W9FFB6_9EURO|nr:putative cyclase [Penicillium argentinense]KAJ5099086.1 putative cyclase [Penicillium argentinense]